MAFIPDKDLVDIYESYFYIFPLVSSMSEEQILKDSSLLDRIIGIFERWVNNNYNTTLDFTEK